MASEKLYAGAGAITPPPVTMSRGPLPGFTASRLGKRSTPSARCASPLTRFGRAMKPYLFVLPAVALLAFWCYKPLLQTVSLAFDRWSMVPGTSPTFVGLQNFTQLLSNKDFGPAVANTIFYTVGMLPFSVVIPLLLAVATQDVSPRAKKIYRAIFFIPMIMAPVTTGTIFQWLCAPGTGLVNQLLAALGLVQAGTSFFSDPNLARVIILLITGWKMMGFSTLLMSAALTGINGEYYEAAKLDGANAFQRFRDITLTMISPTIMLLIMMSLLFSSQWTFASIDVLTQGGPYGMSTNIYYLMYRFAFNDMNVGLSAAAAIMFMVVFGLIALILQRINKRLSFYDN